MAYFDELSNSKNPAMSHLISDSMVCAIFSSAFHCSVSLSSDVLKELYSLMVAWSEFIYYGFIAYEISKFTLQAER